MTIQYQIEKDLPLKDFKKILTDSGLGKRRPFNDGARLDLMLKNSNLVITARFNGEIIGVARSITDFGFTTYLSDLAVSTNYQKQGIGKELLRQVMITAPQARLILNSAPQAMEYYKKIGMQADASCFYIDDINELKQRD